MVARGDRRPEERTASTVDPAALALYLDALGRLDQKERDVYTQSVRLGRSCTDISAGSDQGSVRDVKDTLRLALEKILAAVDGVDHTASGRLADLFGGGVDDANPEEERLLREIRDLARVAPPRRTWGKFRILKTIGAGGFGTVYHAWDPELEQAVALKLYHRDRSERSKDELLGEAEARARSSSKRRRLRRRRARR